MDNKKGSFRKGITVITLLAVTVVVFCAFFVNADNIVGPLGTSTITVNGTDLLITNWYALNITLHNNNTFQTGEAYVHEINVSVPTSGLGNFTFQNDVNSRCNRTDAQVKQYNASGHYIFQNVSAVGANTLIAADRTLNITLAVQAQRPGTYDFTIVSKFNATTGNVTNTSTVSIHVEDNQTPMFETWDTAYGMFANKTSFLSNGSFLNPVIYENAYTAPSINISFNVTVNDSASLLNCSAPTATLYNGSEFNYTFYYNSTWTSSTTCGIETLTDGAYYYVTTQANDSDNVNSTMERTGTELYFTVDKTAPAYTFRSTFVNNTNITSVTNVTELSFAVADNTSGVYENSTMWAMYNGTRYFGNSSTNSATASTVWQHATNLSGSPGVDYWHNITINTTGYPDGFFRIYLWTNDTITNWTGTGGNNTGTETGQYIFVVDDTAPTLSATVSPTTVTAGSAITVICNDADATSGVATYSVLEVKDPSGSVVPGVLDGRQFEADYGTGTYTYSCSIPIDGSGNSAAALVSGSFAVTSSGGTGGGAGGGAGTERTTFGEVVSDTPTKHELKNIGMTLTFTLTDTVAGAVIESTGYDSKPEAVSAPSGKVVQKYLDITAKKIDKDNIASAHIEFEVENSWIADNNIEAATIKLMRYVDGAWVELGTAMVEEGDTVTKYKASTPGFSYFAITGEKLAADDDGTTEEEATAWWLWLIVGVIAVILVAGILSTFVVKKRKKAS